MDADPDGDEGGRDEEVPTPYGDSVEEHGGEKRGEDAAIVVDVNPIAEGKKVEPQEDEWRAYGCPQGLAVLEGPPTGVEQPRQL